MRQRGLGSVIMHRVEALSQRGGMFKVMLTVLLGKRGLAFINRE